MIKDVKSACTVKRLGLDVFPWICIIPRMAGLARLLRFLQFERKQLKASAFALDGDRA